MNVPPPRSGAQQPTASADRPDRADQVTVVIPCYTERRWASLIRTVESVESQGLPPAAITIVTDHNPVLYSRLVTALPHVRVLENRYERGVSGARNTGAMSCETPLVAWLDDDVVARPGWLAALLEPFTDPAVVGTGGAVLPRWSVGRPAWYSDEFLWVVGVTDPSQPAHPVPVRNVWSETMAVRRVAFLAAGGFRLGFGKVGSRSCPEDTDLCIRMGRLGQWLFVPGSRVEHAVPPERSTVGYFLRRCYLEGRGKVAMARLQRAGSDLSDERAFLTRVLGRTLPREFAGLRRAGGRRVALARIAGLVAGLGAAGVGGAVELAAGLLIRPDRLAAVDPPPRTAQL